MQLQLPPEIGPVAGNGRFMLEYGSYAGRNYRFELRICRNPCCQCTDLELRCAPEGTAQTALGADPLCLMVDFAKRKLTLPSQREVDAARNLGQAVLQEIAPVHWQLLAERFLAVKERLTETHDLADFEPQFSPDTLANTGPMVGYHEILPYAAKLQVMADGHIWLLDEQYCLHHACSCHQSAVTFIRMDKPGILRRRKPVTITVRYNYSTGVFTPESPTAPRNPLPDILCAALREKYPNLNSILEKQQRKLFRLLEKATGQTAVETAAETELLRSDAAAVSAPAPGLDPRPSPAKPGRNDPCPCGSGKKYKKCCGRN